MRLHVSLIQQPAIDFGKFLGLTHEALGYSLASSADKSQRPMSDAERFLSCLNSMTNSQATAALNASLTPDLLTHVSFSVLLAADDRDLLGILQAASGMPFVVSDTRARGIQIAVITGTLAQWRDAVICGTQRGGAIQGCFCLIHDQFNDVGLNVWKDCVRKGADKLFYLTNAEHKQ